MKQKLKSRRLRKPRDIQDVRLERETNVLLTSSRRAELYVPVEDWEEIRRAKANYCSHCCYFISFTGCQFALMANAECKQYKNDGTPSFEELNIKLNIRQKGLTRPQKHDKMCI